MSDKIGISGIGVYFPEKIRKNSEWPKKSASMGDRTFNDIPQASGDISDMMSHYLALEAKDPFLGVKERRVGAPDEKAVDVETIAGQKAIQDAGLSPGDINVVLSYNIVPDRISPPSASAVAESLGIKGMAWGVDMACASSIAQMIIAEGLILSGQAQNVLLTQSHLALRAMPMIHPAVPGLGDAASAIVISKNSRWPFVKSHAITHGEFYDAVTWVRGSRDDKDPPWFKAGDQFYMGTKNREAAKELQRDTVKYGAKTIQEAIKKTNFNVDDIKLIASVEPRGWIPKLMAQSLGLLPDIVSSVYETKAHVGACGPIVNLEQAYRQGRTTGNGLIALYAQGAGFSRSSMLLEMEKAQ